MKKTAVNGRGNIAAKNQPTQANVDELIPQIAREHSVSRDSLQRYLEAMSKARPGQPVTPGEIQAAALACKADRHAQTMEERLEAIGASQIAESSIDSRNLWLMPDGTVATCDRDDTLRNMPLVESFELFRDILVDGDCSWNSGTIQPYFNMVIAALKGVSRA
jgi:hypothetical protein